MSISDPWRGAWRAGIAPSRDALHEVDDEHAAVHWGEHVSDEEYNAAEADTSREYATGPGRHLPQTTKPGEAPNRPWQRIQITRQPPL